jgi:hypothetical protein
LREGKVPAGLEACREDQGDFRPLADYPEFRALARRPQRRAGRRRRADVPVAEPVAPPPGRRRVGLILAAGAALLGCAVLFILFVLFLLGA